MITRACGNPVRVVCLYSKVAYIKNYMDPDQTVPSVRLGSILFDPMKKSSLKCT